MRRNSCDSYSYSSVCWNGTLRTRYSIQLHVIGCWRWCWPVASTLHWQTNTTYECRSTRTVVRSTGTAVLSYTAVLVPTLYNLCYDVPCLTAVVLYFSAKIPLQQCTEGGYKVVTKASYRITTVIGIQQYHTAAASKRYFAGQQYCRII